MPYTLSLSHSSRAMAMVNQPVLNQELELFLEDKRGSQGCLLQFSEINTDEGKKPLMPTMGLVFTYK